LLWASVGTSADLLKLDGFSKVLWLKALPGIDVLDSHLHLNQKYKLKK
jgi:hypothetical protein